MKKFTVINCLLTMNIDTGRTGLEYIDEIHEYIPHSMNREYKKSKMQEYQIFDEIIQSRLAPLKDIKDIKEISKNQTELFKKFDTINEKIEKLTRMFELLLNKIEKLDLLREIEKIEEENNIKFLDNGEKEIPRFEFPQNFFVEERKKETKQECNE